jgi:hypothetical protein
MIGILFEIFQPSEEFLHVLRVGHLFQCVLTIFAVVLKIYVVTETVHYFRCNISELFQYLFYQVFAHLSHFLTSEL